MRGKIFSLVLSALLDERFLAFILFLSPTSATRGQNACNVLIFRSRKPKVGTTRHRAEERGRGAQTQIRGGGWAGKFSLSC